MAIGFLSLEVADLTLGKPPLSVLPAAASVRDALQALRRLGEEASEISVWRCSEGHRSSGPDGDRPRNRLPHAECDCLGKVRMIEIICYLGRDESLRDPHRALRQPVTALLAPGPPSVLPIHPHASLLDALELMVVNGAQNLVVPITTSQRWRGDWAQSDSTTGSSNKHVSTLRGKASGSGLIRLSKDHGGKEYCWITQEDVLRFMLGSIAVFAPLPVTSIQDLGIIQTELKWVEFQEDAAVAREMMMVMSAQGGQVLPIAVIDRPSSDVDHTRHKLIGDISSCSLRACNETAALAMATLSAGDFVLYAQECKNPPDALVGLIRSKIVERIGDRKQGEMWEGLSSSSDCDDDNDDNDDDDDDDDNDDDVYSPTGPYELSQKWQFRTSFRVGSFGMKNRSGPIFCNPGSSLIAVLLQALSHQESHVWVIRGDDDDTVVGVVTFSDILRVMFNHINVYRT